MKVSLMVAEGPHKGKTIPVSRPQFFIGRDPTCHLRPASSMISRRHCVLLLRGEKVFVRDFGSTNGTRVNSVRVDGEIELHHDDRLTIDPLDFVVRVEKTSDIARLTPVPFRTAAPEADDESVAEMLLNLQVEGDGSSGSASEVPGGTTIIQPAVSEGTEASAEKVPEKKNGTPPRSGDTSTAAQEILAKYHRKRKLQ
jgi:pSer/pThr/pTyr-binding forkhead associated (FHA) protein